MKQRKTNNEDGFTLTELMVAIMVGALMVSFTYSLYTFVGHLVSAWKKTTEIRSVAERSARQIAGDIERSKSCSELTDSSLVLIQGMDKTIRYSFQPSMAYRNGDALDIDSASALIVKVERVEKEYHITSQLKMGRLQYTTEARAEMLESGKEEFNLKSNH
jgi:prepilin-type N-terminal cleavage/methylation domain-containing protein